MKPRTFITSKKAHNPAPWIVLVEYAERGTVEWSFVFREFAEDFMEQHAREGRNSELYLEEEEQE